MVSVDSSRTIKEYVMKKLLLVLMLVVVAVQAKPLDNSQHSIKENSRDSFFVAGANVYGGQNSEYGSPYDDNGAYANPYS